VRGKGDRGNGLKKDEIIVVVVIFLFGGLTALLSLRMPIGTFRMAGTGMFPLFLGILLMVLSAIFIVRIFYQDRKTTAGKVVVSGDRNSPAQLILFLGTMVLATAFLNKLGYPLTSFLLMMALLRSLGVKKWIFNLILSLMTAGASYFLFVQWLKIPMPKGWIGL
jgi:putative tricarboxylic transport membrane protein